MHATGVYKIVNSANGRVYIGQAVNLRARWHSHRGALQRGTHHNRHLQSAWNKHGSQAFSMRPLLICAKQDLVFYEQLCLDAYRAVEIGYNKCPIAESSVGRKLNPEGIAKMAATKRGVAKSPEARAAHAAAMARPEVRAKISASTKGLKRPPASSAHRAALSAALIGRKLSKASRAKIAAANIGTKHGPHSAETRLKISLAQKGRPLSSAHVASLRIAQQLRRAQERGTQVA